MVADHSRSSSMSSVDADLSPMSPGRPDWLAGALLDHDQQALHDSPPSGLLSLPDHDHNSPARHHSFSSDSVPPHPDPDAADSAIGLDRLPLSAPLLDGSSFSSTLPLPTLADNHHYHHHHHDHHNHNNNHLAHSDSDLYCPSSPTDFAITDAHADDPDHHAKLALTSLLNSPDPRLRTDGPVRRSVQNRLMEAEARLRGRRRRRLRCSVDLGVAVGVGALAGSLGSLGSPGGVGFGGLSALEGGDD